MADTLDDFLSKVDELESIVKCLGSNNTEEVEEAVNRADEMLFKVQNQKKTDSDGDCLETTIGFSKTSINKKAFQDDLQTGNGSDGQSQEFFMASMEEDAKKRAENRKRREKEANEIKEKGNEEFRNGNYDKALEHYTKAIEKVKDSTALYTNRAQTLIKLSRYSEAIVDCSWALRVCPNCIKAHIHLGRSYLGLAEYDKARDSYTEALKIDPKKEQVIKGYIAEVDRAEVASAHEARANELFKSGNQEATNMVKLLEEVLKVGQLPLFYSGGFRVIANLMCTADERTLFHTNGGFQLLVQHPTLSRCIASSPLSLSHEEIDLLTSATVMYNAACLETEKNQEFFINTKDLPNRLLSMLEAKLKSQGRPLKVAIVSLLYQFSLSEYGRMLLITNFDVLRLLALIFALIRSTRVISLNAVRLLNNLALEKKLQRQLQGNIEDLVIPAFVTLLTGEVSDAAVIPTCVTSMINLTGNKTICHKVAANRNVWQASAKLLDRYKANIADAQSEETVSATLGLLMNISTKSSQCVREFAVNICQHCVSICSKQNISELIVRRSIGAISHVLPHSIPAVDWICDNHGPKLFLDYINTTKELQQTALKCLTTCTEVNDSARSYTVDNNGVESLRNLLISKDEVIVGNAALCLSHCTRMDDVCCSIVNTDIIERLLTLARDGRQAAVQQNCAILIAKLAQGDSRHLQKLRDLHGVEILHSCMKHMK